MGRMKRSKVYNTGAAFRTALEDRLGKIAFEEGVDLQRIRRQVSFDRLLARLAQARIPLGCSKADMRWNCVTGRRARQRTSILHFE